jgi:hypothetical protein
VCLQGRPVVLDYVSRPDVWAALWRPLARGYCLDALALEQATTTGGARAAAEFRAAADAIVPVEHDAIGMGRLLALEGDGVAGLGLMFEGELIHASVFPSTAP